MSSKLTFALGGAALAASLQPALAFDLQALIEAARAEPPLTVYDSTGKIVQQAQAFAETYGLEAVGTKANAVQTLEIVIREAQAGNVQTDVAIIADAPAVMVELIAAGHVTSWAPEDMLDDIPQAYQDPLTIVMAPNVWAYNTSLHDSCPITNIWQLTEPDWARRVAMQDPLGKPSYTDWFNQMETHGDAAMADAYQAHFGRAYDGEGSATAAWVAALAANAPLLTDSDSAAADAVGAPDQSDAFIGLVSTAKFRENAAGMVLGLCDTMQPWVGWGYPSIALIASGTDSPNAARLFLHYLMTEEGIAPQAADGKLSTSRANAVPADEPSGVDGVRDRLFGYVSATAEDDWDTRQDWQDLWSINYRR